MASTSPTSLSERVAELTQHNNTTAPLPPLPVAAQSPFHEVLMRDLAASLPAELAKRLEAATTVGDVHDWLAAGAVYRWLEEDTYLSRLFLEEVSNDPKSAGLTLAKALAARMGPVARDAQWHCYDRIGLVLQLGVASLLLVCRGLPLYILDHNSRYGFSFPPELGHAEVMRGVVGLTLLPRGLSVVSLSNALLGCATLWLVFEAVYAPRVMESVRQFPAKLQNIPPPLIERVDTFYVIWVIQTMIFWALICLYSWDG